MPEDNFIINGKQKKRFKWIELLLTFAGWSYLLGFLISILLTITLWVFNFSRFYALFNIKSMMATLRVLIITLIIAVSGFGVMLFWRHYNLRKYGALRRRKFPKDFDADATSEYFSLSINVVEEFKTSRLITLEKTIV